MPEKIPRYICKPLVAMLIFALASFSIVATFGIILFLLPESCRDKKSLLALCRPKSKLQEGKSGRGKLSE